MKPFLRFITFIIVLASTSTSAFSQTDRIILNTRLSFYSNEVNGEMLLRLPAGLAGQRLNISLTLKGKIISEQKMVRGKPILRLPFSLIGLTDSAEITTSITTAYNPPIKYSSSAIVRILPHKENEVKTDRLTGGMIVNQKPFFPFGFYCYSPVFPTLPEEEVVKGFNMISPYQKILPRTLNERKAYMDRCAQLGMKVHYNLLSVTGGGGVGSRIDSISDEQKRELLINEIKTFMNHPALLAWYISDEPTGNKVTPETLNELYRIVKQADPWHPVSIVFMAPYKSAVDFADALDIVMADPYPVPDLPVSLVGDVASMLKKEFSGKKPVWIVPQAFGGGELWSREPSSQEVRSMTWQSIIQGATGIQYFIRSGLNSFPKSTAVWSECGKIALEINLLTPWLLSEEETIPVSSSSKNILVTSRYHNGQLVVMVVNKINEPQRVEIQIEKYFTGKARVMFENRPVSVNGGVLTDQIGAFGSQAYRIDLNMTAETVVPYKGNMIMDPGFEDITGMGAPVACYAGPGGDRGATYFLDGSEHVEGNYSLKLITPADNKSVFLRFFPMNLKTGCSYMISLWAKGDNERRFVIEDQQLIQGKTQIKTEPQYVEVGLGEFGKARFVPFNEWKQFVTFVTIPPDTVPKKKVNLTLKMPGQGVAWFDMLQVIEDPLKR